MYNKFHQDRKGVKHLKLVAKKVSGEEGEDTSSRSILDKFQTDTKIEFRSAVNGIAIAISCFIRIQILGMPEACKEDFSKAHC